jgi:cytochrome c biogenesis protein
MSMVLRTLSSLKLTLVGMLALLTGVLVSYRDDDASSAWITLPLLMLAVNLLAALCMNPRLYRQGGLLVFHLCLLAILLLAMFGRLAGFKGRLEIAEGQRFDPAAVTLIRQGPWHAWSRLQSLAFEQGRIRIAYAPGLIRGRTQSDIHLGGAGVTVETLTVGDNVALEAAGYRFYTTSNKGYAVMLTWLGDDGAVQPGALHLPSYPLHEWRQINRWRTPSGEPIEFELNLPQRPIKDRSWVLTGQDTAGTLSLRAGDGDSQTLRPGEVIRLAGGGVRFDGIRLWMGYEIFHDPALPWLFAAALVGVTGLAWHFRDRFRAQLLAGDTAPQRGTRFGLSANS